MFQYHIVTSSEYKLGVKNAEDLYFLSDTLELYRGEVSYTQAVRFYDAPKPVNATLNVFYIEKNSMLCSVYNGTEWLDLFEKTTDTITTDGTAPVSSKAVIAYVNQIVSELASSADVVKDVSYDGTEHLMTITKGDDSQSSFVLNGLGCSITYNRKTGDLSLVDASGNQIGDSINLDLERFIASAYYDSDAKKIIMSFNDTDTVLPSGDYTYPDNMPTDSEVVDGVYVKIGENWYVYSESAWTLATDTPTLPLEIDVADLVDTYTVESSDTVDLTMVSNKISAAIKISSEAGNMLVKKDDGLYVAPTDISGKMDKDQDAVAGNVAVFDENGNAVDSGLSADEIGGKPALFIGTTEEEAIGEATPKQGDILILTKTIADDKVERTAYFYNNNAWVAMDGNYSAENVFYSEDLLTTYALGNFSLTNGQATIPAAGKNLAQVWKSIFITEKSPVTTQPSVSVSMPQAKAYEVGTSVTPTYTATLNAGKYTYGPETGITAKSWEVSDTAGHTSTANSGSFDAFVVDDSTNYKVTATASYNDGAVPVTNIGNAYDAGKIVAGSKTGVSSAITGFRNGFYGTLTTKDTPTSDVIRGLTASGESTRKAPKAGDVWEIPIPVGAVRVIFAYPATLEDVASVADVNGMGAEIKTAFTMTNVDVEGANNHTAISYKVYVTDFASPIETANTYKVTI